MALFCSKIDIFNVFSNDKVCAFSENTEKHVTCNPTTLLTTADILVYPSRLLFVVIADLCHVIFLPQCYRTLYSCVINYFQLIQCGHLGSEFFCTTCIISIGALYSIMCMYRNFSDHYSVIEHPGFLSLLNNTDGHSYV